MKKKHEELQVENEKLRDINTDKDLVRVHLYKTKPFDNVRRINQQIRELEQVIIQNLCHPKQYPIPRIYNGVR